MAKWAGILTLLGVLLLGANRSAEAQTGEGVPPPSGAEAQALSPLYAAIFEPGRTFQYNVHARNQVYDPENPGANEDGYLIEESDETLVCTVEAHPLGAAMVSTMACENEVPSGERSPCETVCPAVMGNSFVATPDGLWLVYEVPTSEADVGVQQERGQLMFEATVAAETETETTEYGGGDEREVARDPGGGWCVRHSVWGGDETTTVRCFAEGQGIVSATWSWSGGSNRDLIITQQSAP